MNNDLIMKAITLSGEEKKVTQNGSTIIKIKDENGLTYSFFMKKQDGSDSKAYEGYKNFQLGDTVEIHYSEQQRTTQDGKPYTARNVAFFGEKVSGSHPAESPHGEASSASQGHSSDAFGRRLAVQGHLNALLSNPKVFTSTEDSVSVPNVVRWAIQVEDEAERQLNPSAFRQAVQKHAPQVVEDLPVIQQGEDISVEDIPY